MSLWSLHADRVRLRAARVGTRDGVDDKCVTVAFSLVCTERKEIHVSY